ncbi:LysR family transcriptional regulator [Aestuariispira insulae]|uniref:LysR family transcriptional regulator n=1 Tax=Aestuariispira insulae TaxID=1461337 RepID=A0A3D9HRA9_9PROT|nr:LysR family transcriptional regulator [Aestuariispira insulae]RED52022.1 LysR family transcriptional regulator [Aestuariispira insulae]
MWSQRNISAFVAVAEQGNFAAAAHKLGLSTSATSKAIARLEEGMGVKLFHRTTRSVSMTAEGERFYDGARRLLDEFSTLAREISDQREHPHGRLSISAPAAYNRPWLTRLISGFALENPEISIELTYDEREIDLAAEGVDVAIRAIRVFGATPKTNLISRQLLVDPLVTCAAPDYLERHGIPQTVEDLEHHACLNFRNPRTGQHMPWTFTINGQVEKCRFKGPMTINDGEEITHAAETGLGIAQQPSLAVRKSLEAGRLVEILSPFRPTGTPMLLVWLDRRLVSPRIRAFVDYMVRETATVRD